MRSQNNKLKFSLILTAILLIVFVSINGLNLGSYKIDPIQDSVKLGLDIKGGVVVVYEAQTDKRGAELQKTMNQVQSVMSKRIDEFGLTEPNITIQGEDRIRIELPGVKNTQEALKVIGDTAQLEFLRAIPEGNQPTQVLQDMTKEDFKYEEVLKGKDVKDSFVTKDKNGKPAVALELNSSGTDAFYEATKKGGQIPIMLDGKVISAPVANPNEPIANGEAIISGSFTYERASSLASLIRGGALPVEMKEIQTSVIGPTLGLNAMEKAVDAAKIGLALVMLFLIIYYKLPGLIASMSLSLYASLLLIILNAFGATLTLPGIAGLVLSLGMAVDANVIIFERLKEELKNGKTVRSSLNFGYQRAMRTIIDANITTLIAGVVLYNFGQGPIKGFAITLMIGIVASMFTAIIVTKSILMNGLVFDIFNNKKFFRA